MKAKTVRNLSAALVSIFIFALFILVGGLLYYYRQGITNAENIIASLIDREMEFPSLTENTVLPDRLTKKLDTALSLNENLAAISVTVDNNLVYAKQKIANEVIENTDDSILASSSLFLKTFTTNFTTENGANGIVSAAIYVLNQEEIFKSARIAFLMILAATLATIILIVYTKLYPDKGNTAHSQIPDEENDPDEINTEQKKVEPEPGQPVPVPVQLPKESLQIPHEAVTQPVFQSTLSAETDSKPNTNFFSDETGFLRETYIEQVLDPMLINAASRNEDIAFLLILIPGLDRASETGKEVCKSILEQFKSKERIFEYGSDSFAAILQNSDAEKAVAEASELYLTLNAKVTETDPPPEIRIGIATKAFRTTVAASAMLDEARQAIARAAINPDTPIVALKINPEKYREFIENE
jgi:GGDEF domain-containing protein